MKDYTPLMDFNIPPILTPDQLMDKAFKRASKKHKKGSNRKETTKKTISIKLNTVAHILEDTLKRYEKEFPSIDMLPPFYVDIIDITIGRDQLKKSLGALNWARRKIKRTLMESARNLMSLESVDKMQNIQKGAYGRTASILRQVSDDLEFLGEARKKLNSLPDIKTEIPTVVVAGYPNVGKSLLVSKMSSGKPKVAIYPFTTKEVGIGHFKVGHHICQLLDTPGLLDRPEEERNEIEMQAVRALENLADVIVFLFDPSETCGYSIEEQESLAKEIKQTFPDIPIIEVENKIDLVKRDNERLKISSFEETNLEKLKELIENHLDVDTSLEAIHESFDIDR
ncbi:MAG: NOG1 family protein [Candidatus Natronoplasma sp.]